MKRHPTPARLLAPALGLLLAACAVPANRLHDAATTRIDLTGAITFAAYATEQALQAGNLVGEDKLYDAEPYCVLRLREVHSQPFTLAAGQFRVQRVVYREELFADTGRVVRLASAGGGGVGPEETLYYFQTVFQIAGSDLYSITCQRRDDYALGSHLSLKDFHTAAGDWLRLAN